MTKRKRESEGKYERPCPVLSSQFPKETADKFDKIVRATGKKRADVLREVVHTGLPIYIEENDLSKTVKAA